MHLVILLLAALAFFIYLTLGVRDDPERRKLLVLYVVIDLWLSAVFLYLLVTAVNACEAALRPPISSFLKFPCRPSDSPSSLYGFKLNL